MTPAQRLFKRALSEKLAFIPMGSADPQQAAGPGGQPVAQGGSAAMGGMPPGGAPMDPAAMGGMPPGGAPMDPAAMGGMPPMDPAAMGGMPPMDPAAMGGMPPMDPAAMGGMPPEEDKPDTSKASLTLEDSEIVDKITQRTMDIVRQTLEMVGKAKTKDQVSAEAAAKSQEVAVPEAAAQPGPISGVPGFDPTVIQGPLKTASILSRFLGK